MANRATNEGQRFRSLIRRDATAARVAERISESGGEVWAAGPGDTPIDREIESLNVAIAAGILLERLRSG